MARRDARLLLAAALAALLGGSGALGQLQVDFGQVRAAPPPPPPPPPPPRPRRTAALAQPGGRGANSGPPRGKGGRSEGKARPQGPDEAPLPDAVQWPQKCGGGSGASRGRMGAGEGPARGPQDGDSGDAARVPRCGLWSAPSRVEARSRLPPERHQVFHRGGNKEGTRGLTPGARPGSPASTSPEAPSHAVASGITPRGPPRPRTAGGLPDSSLTLRQHHLFSSSNSSPPLSAPGLILRPAIGLGQGPRRPAAPVEPPEPPVGGSPRARARAGRRELGQ